MSLRNDDWLATIIFENGGPMDLQPNLEPELVHVLEPGEAVQAAARATEAILAVSDRRVFIATSGRLALSIRIEELRRIQFDIEKSRPATLVIVPEASRDEPQVLAIPPDQIRSTAEALALIAERLAAAGDRRADATS